MKILLDQNSMLFWYPLTQFAKVPMPETMIIQIGHMPLMGLLEGIALPADQMDLIKASAQQIGYPLFLRTDQASGKHDWERSCFVQSEEVLLSHIASVIEFNELAGFLGLPYEALVLRKFIPLEHKFTAFWGNMPVAKERRYFVLDGKVQCHHPYWPEEAIAKSRNKPDNWQELLASINTESDEEIALLTNYAEEIGHNLDGYWSVDFAKGEDGQWYFIDAALGKDSWHPVCNYSYPHPEAKRKDKKDPLVNIFLIE